MFYLKGGEVLWQDYILPLHILKYFNSYTHGKLDEVKLGYMENIQSIRKLFFEVFFYFLGRKKSHTKHKKFYQEKTPEFSADTETYQ